MAAIKSKSRKILKREIQLNLKAILIELGEEDKYKNFLRQGLHSSSSESSGKACFNDKRGLRLIPPKFARLNPRNHPK